MGKVRGVRFSDAEEKQLKEFLDKNPFLDFSTLARIAIVEFIKKPILNLRAVSKENSTRKGTANVRTT